MKRRAWLAGAAPLLLAAGAIRGAAQDPSAAAWPSRPIRLVAGSAPGGSLDAAARILAPRLSERLGVPVVVENRSGAAGALAFEPVARAAPDGHTLVMSFMGALVINPLLQPELGLRPFEELPPVSPWWWTC